MPSCNARISEGPIIPNDVYKGLPVRPEGATGAQYWTKSQFTFSHTWIEELSFRRLDSSIWGLAFSWDKSQGIRRKLEQITMKSLPIYLFKSRGKQSSFKIISIYYFCFQPMLLRGLIIYRESLPGSGERAVSWKTQSTNDGTVIMEGGNSKLKHEQQAQGHYYVPNPSTLHQRQVVCRCELHKRKFIPIF